MKLEIKGTRHIETTSPQHRPTASFGSRADTARSAHNDSEIPVAAEKLQGFTRPLFVITGMALCMGLSSCVIPYDSHGGSSTTFTTYRPGYRVNSLPDGYRSEVISGSTYYYHDGYYYLQGSGGYVVVDAPRSSRYYDDYDRRHRSNQSNRQYQESPNRHDGRYDRGEVITRLPDGYRVLNHRGNTYYQTGDRYYRRDNDTYVIVSRPY